MTVEHEESVRIGAPPERVWAVYTDVERWPEWTPAMRKIERLEDGPLALGSTARIEGRSGPASVWKVTEYTAGKSFTWETAARGIRIVGWHNVEADGDGSLASMGVRFSGGLLAKLMGSYLRSVARRNVGLEAEGLKRRCERQR
jgi:carbon monoxide dehydrogenase subunit G